MSSKSRRRVRRRVHDAAKHLSAQARSGLGVAAYCRRAGIPESSFYNWRQRERKARGANGPSVAQQGASFVELTGRAGVAGGYRVSFRSGAVLEVPSGFRRDELHELIGILSERGGC